MQVVTYTCDECGKSVSDTSYMNDWPRMFNAAGFPMHICWDHLPNARRKYEGKS